MPSTPSLPTGHQALYRRWRAQTFSQIVGQKAVVETLRNAVRFDRLAHGFLFVGPRGTGKTSMARILAKAVNCPNLVDGEPCDACEACVSIRDGRALDVVELDAASNNKVDDMRELLPRVYTGASDLRRKVFIIDEVQRIKEGWDVLLKTLEEPPDSVLFVFCTTNPSQIRPAVVSRLQRFTFRPLTPAEIRGKLERILAGDGRRAEPEAIELIARLAAGGMRDAETMLDQVLSTADEELTEASVRELLGLAEQDVVDAFIAALVMGDALAGIRILDDLESAGSDLVAFSDQVVTRLRSVLVERLAGRTDGLGKLASLPVAALAGAARRVAGLDANRAGAGGYRFQLELALLQAAAPAVESVPTGAREAAEAPTRDRRAAPERPAVPERPAAPERPGAPQRPAAPERPGAPQPTAAAVDAGRAASASAAPPSPTSAPAPRPAPSGDPTVTAASHNAASDPAREGTRPGLPPSEALERLRAAWPTLMAQIARNPAYRPLVEACRPVDVRDGVVFLGFREDQGFLRAKAEQKRSVFEEAIQDVLGRPFGVRCVVTNLDALEPLPTTGEEVDLVEHAKRIFGGDIADVGEIR